MYKLLFSFRSTIAICFVLTLLCSCFGISQKRYIKQIKTDIPLYDSINAYLLARYFPLIKGGGSVTIYPSNAADGYDYFTRNDPTILNFCRNNDIEYIRIDAVPTIITYFLPDNNYQYIFTSEGNNTEEVFENTRVAITPINKYWVFQYEKPNF